MGWSTLEGTVSGPALAFLLFGILLLLVAAMLWQEAKRRGGPLEGVYAVEDALTFISPRLPDEVRSRLGGQGLRRVIEWEVFYLQGLAQDDRRNPVETVAGGSEAAVQFIIERIATVHGASYEPADVRAVLVGEADYLASIGAIGEPLGGDEQ